MGIVMRHSKLFTGAGTTRTLYFALVRSNLDFGSVIWSSLGDERSKSLERIQKRLLKYLYSKDFGYYETDITYKELVLGYELTTLKERRDLTLLLFLRDLVMSKIDSVQLLEKITFHVPPRASREKTGLFRTPRCRTAQFQTAPLNRMQKLYNTVEKIDANIDIFFDSRAKYTSKILSAIRVLHNQQA